MSEPLALEDGDVHVWRACLDVSKPLLGLCWEVLFADERARALRYVFERDRRRFVAGRGLLRLLLARYVGNARISDFVEGRRQRKAQAGSCLRARVQPISLARGCVYALARRPVGVDVEHIRAVPDALDLADRFFSRREVAALRMLEGHQLIDSFFRCWTRKEAYVKASGHGIGFPLDSFSVSLDSEQPQLLYCDLDPTEPPRLTLRNLQVAGGYVAALAIAAEVQHLDERLLEADTPNPY